MNKVKEVLDVLSKSIWFLIKTALLLLLIVLINDQIPRKPKYGKNLFNCSSSEMIDIGMYGEGDRSIKICKKTFLKMIVPVQKYMLSEGYTIITPDKAIWNGVGQNYRYTVSQ